MGTVKEEAAKVRKIIKKKLPKVSVRMGRGTAGTNIEIRGSGKHGFFTKKEYNTLKRMGLSPGANAAILLPDDRKKFLKRYG